MCQRRNSGCFLKNLVNVESQNMSLLGNSVFVEYNQLEVSSYWTKFDPKTVETHRYRDRYCKDIKLFAEKINIEIST